MQNTSQKVAAARVNTSSMVINFRIFSRPLTCISLDGKYALCYSSFSFKAQLKWPNILKGAFIRLTLSGRGIHRITVQMTSYFNCGRSGSISETLRYAVSLYGYEQITCPVTSRKFGHTALPRRKRQATGVNNDLIARGGTLELRSMEYKSKNQMGFQLHLKESLDQKLTLKIPLLNC